MTFRCKRKKIRKAKLSTNKISTKRLFFNFDQSKHENNFTTIAVGSFFVKTFSHSSAKWHIQIVFCVSTGVHGYGKEKQKFTFVYCKESYIPHMYIARVLTLNLKLWWVKLWNKKLWNSIKLLARSTTDPTLLCKKQGNW